MNCLPGTLAWKCHLYLPGLAPTVLKWELHAWAKLTAHDMAATFDLIARSFPTSFDTENLQEHLLTISCFLQRWRIQREPPKLLVLNARLCLPPCLPKVAPSAEATLFAEWQVQSRHLAVAFANKLVTTIQLRPLLRESKLGFLLLLPTSCCTLV